MKTYSSALTNYRANGNGHGQVNFLSFRVRDRSTSAKHWVHLSSRPENETVQVVNQTSGSLEYRDYAGDGTIVDVDDLIRSEGTGVRNFNLVLSGIHTAVLDMIQGYDCRDADFEWHIGEMDEATGLLVDTPVCEFLGFVDTIDPQDAGFDAETDGESLSNFTVSVVSHISTLQRTNPDMRSHEVGQERSNDDIFIYSDSSNQWEVYWGKRGHRHKDRDDKDGRDKPTEPSDPWGHR
jgi:hypothetical protein